MSLGELRSLVLDLLPETMNVDNLGVGDQVIDHVRQSGVKVPAAPARTHEVDIDAPQAGV